MRTRWREGCVVRDGAVHFLMAHGTSSVACIAQYDMCGAVAVHRALSVTDPCVLCCGVCCAVLFAGVCRQCSSGLQAIADVAAAIKAGFYTVGLAAGGSAQQLTHLLALYVTNIACVC